jgi:peptidyl-prolyl cis-trans isomerase A (cyclophilin A)
MRTLHRALGCGLALALALPGCTHEAKSTEPAETAGTPKASGGAAPGNASAPAAPAEPAASAAAPAADYGPHNLMDPKSPLMNETAPDVYRARFETGAGAFEIEVTRAWSPNGADRFYNLVKNGFFEGSYFFRAVAGFMLQFGLPADPKVAAAWMEATLKDDPRAGKSNARGMVTFANTGAPNSRSTQLFINLVDNSGLDAQGFTPIGQVVSGMESVDAVHTGYGDGPPRGRGPDQNRLRQLGSAYLEQDFPNLTRIDKTSIVER